MNTYRAYQIGDVKEEDPLLTVEEQANLPPILTEADSQQLTIQPKSTINKADMVRSFFKDNPNSTRSQAISFFKDVIKLSKCGANTYYQNHKPKTITI